ncbi:MAG TPA: PBSX family phage terminase large subunit [Methylomirabilota bacterium]|nr:PBSX family phage terminase large subunit [Methylomirabilota bacterium]
MSNEPIWVNYQRHRKVRFLAEPHPYKVLYGGRGGIKSWSIARQLLIDAAERPIKTLCARETMQSIAESVHSLLEDQIGQLKLGAYFEVQKSTIRGRNGSIFAFAGLRHNVNQIKSYEGFDRAWVEEAQNVSHGSWKILIPTIRKEGSEIWVSFNPELESDSTYQRFVLNPPPGTVIVKTSWRDNLWLSEKFKADMEHLRTTNLSEYNHVYEGLCLTTIEGAYFADELEKCELEDRITRVPYDPTIPVHTFWDLGIGDMTSIWFVQPLPFEYRVIDYLEDSGKKLQFYLDALQHRAYLYGAHHLPHDAQARELGTGKSTEELVRVAYPDKVEIVTKLSVTDRINAARTIFGQCYFDKEKCADGLQALRHYRKAPADTMGRDTGELHDWASHGGSAFCYFGVGVRRPERPPRQSAPDPDLAPGAWMG